MQTTHREGSWVGMSLCGERWAGPYTESPTCMLCIAGDDEVGGIRRILEMNSVKEMQALEDAKFIEQVDAVIEKNKP
jgi:hypothetical protein